MATLIAHPENDEKADALRAFMNAQEIQFEEGESPYDPAFVEKIKRSEADFEAGRFKVINIDDLWK